MSRMVALLPLSFSELDICKREVFSFRIADVGFLLLWILGLFTLCGCNLHYAAYGFPNLPGKIKTTFILFAFVFPVSKIVVIITTNFITIGYIPKLLKKFLIIDQFIDRRSRMYMHKRIRLGILKTGAIMFLTQIILCSVQYYVNTDGTIMAVLKTSLQNLSFTFYIILSVEYVSIVHMLKYRYEYFNDILLKCFKKENVATEPLSKYKNVSLDVNIAYIELPTASSRNLTRTARALNGRHTINDLSMVYLKLYDTAALTNSYFGIPVLLETVSMITMCVTALYYGVYLLDCDSDIYGNIVNRYLLSGYLISCSILCLSLFAWLIVCCHNTIQEANKGIYFIHRISLNRDIHYSIITELDRLLSQLKNMRIQFTACGLFALNLPFLCTVFSAVLTYILIIVQIS
jgi:hypothetical protein